VLPRKSCRDRTIRHYDAGSSVGESLPKRETGKRRGAAFRTGIIAALAIVCAGRPLACNAASRHKLRQPVLQQIIKSGRAAVETVYFHDRPPVRVVRGGQAPAPRPPSAPHVATLERTEIVDFGASGRVAIVRGVGSAGATAPVDARRRIEKVSFADPRLPPVTIVREWGTSLPPTVGDLFGPADGGELDRIAFAVDGIESRHGDDLAMWRPEFAGPQGPMQVSAAAAFDVGGGDRFDVQENRLLGRAYLAQMFRRYGNWPDALAAYNWGPANVDKWIVDGRDPYQMPPGVAWYVTRALHDAMIAIATGW
jgi:hypothetical protein